MKKLVKFLMLDIALFLSIELMSQSIQWFYSTDFEFEQGIYLNYQEFKTNSPGIKQFRVVAAPEYSKQDIRNGRPIKWVEYRDSLGYQKALKQKDMWGLCFENEIYIYKANALQRIKVIGALMLVDEVRKVKNIINEIRIKDDYNPSGRGYTFPTYTKIIDFVTGISYSSNLKNFQLLLKKDPVLFEEFNKLEGNKMKKEKMSDYLTIFNNRNPIYFKVKEPGHAFKP